MCFGQNGAVSCISLKKKKKKEANGAVLNGTISLLFPLATQRIGEENAKHWRAYHGFQNNNER